MVGGRGKTERDSDTGGYGERDKEGNIEREMTQVDVDGGRGR